MIIRKCLLFSVVGCSLIGNSAQAAFHLMQIEQVIGGVNGDTSAQAIQLRMRSGFQNVVSSARLTVVDAAGANPILLKDMTTDVANSAAGSRILLTTSVFASHVSPALVSDFTLTNPIPASYLAAGQLRFTDDGGAIFWSLSWGGVGFTGSTAGEPFHSNDSDGTFGPAFGSALSSTNLQALRFTGASAALSTTNAADYAFSSSPATFTNNAGATFILTAPPIVGDYNGDGHVDTNDYTAWRQTFGNSVTASSGADGNGDGVIDAADYVIWRNQPPSGAGSSTGGGSSLQDAFAVPEPTAVALLLLGFLSTRLRHRQPGCIEASKRLAP